MLVRWRLFPVLLAVLAAGVGQAGWLSPHGAGHHVPRGTSVLPTAARGVVASTVGAADRRFWMQRSEGRLVIRGPELAASFSRQGVALRRDGVLWRQGLSGYGYGKRLQHAGSASLTANRNRVLYHWPALGVTEWYANGPLGIEQGFTLLRPPSGRDGGALTLSLGRLPSGLVARIETHGRSLVLLRRGRPVFRYDGLFASDAAGHAVAARLALSGNRLLLRIDSGGAQFPLQVDPFLEAGDQTVKPFDFGYSVAISGNGGTVAVGAPGATVDGRSGQGAVYVFRKGAGGWSDEHEVARLTASAGVASDGLGTSVAISHNGETIAASTHPNASTGGIYVFQEPSGGWVSEHEGATLTPSPGAATDEFGAVAISGDGTTVAAATSSSDYYGYTTDSAVFVFTKPAAGWTSEHPAAELTSSDGGIKSGASAVAVSDNGGTVVVGASSAIINGVYEEHYNYGQGAVYVFTRPVSGWTSTRRNARLLASHAAAGQQFGASVAISHSGRMIVVGAPGANGVYVFIKHHPRWNSTHQTAELSGSRSRSGGSFTSLGNAVAIARDSATISAGSSGGGDRGVVFVFTKPRSGSWKGSVSTAKLRPSPGAFDTPGRSLPPIFGGYFGASLAMSGNAATIISGAWGVNQIQGAAYVFSRRSGRWSNGHEVAVLTGSHSSADDDFGISVAVSGDGRTLVAGAPTAWVAGHHYQGALFVFTRASGGWTNPNPTAELTASYGAGGENLGVSVAISDDGSTIAGGAPNAQTGPDRRGGAVFLFREPAGGWANEHPAAKLTDENLGGGSGFGEKLALSRDGRTLVVGAPQETVAGTDLRGELSVFTRPTTGWRNEQPGASLTASGDAYFLGFPITVSGNGSTIAAGAMKNHGQGEVIVFSKPPGGWASEHQAATLGLSFSQPSLAISADGSTLAVGAEGRVAIYSKPAGGWTREPPTAKLKASNAAGDTVGFSVAISADGSTIAAGGPADTSAGPAPYHGAIYVFTKPATGWASGQAQAAKLTASDGVQGDCLGCSVAISADGTTIVSGAPNANRGAYGTGAAYAFTQPSGGWSDEQQTAKLGR